jgi:hypothetical protein
MLQPPVYNTISTTPEADMTAVTSLCRIVTSVQTGIFKRNDHVSDTELFVQGWKLVLMIWQSLRIHWIELYSFYSGCIITETLALVV